MVNKTKLEKIFYVAILATVAVVVYLLANKGTENFEDALVSRTQQYLLAIARAQAESVDVIINHVNDELEELAENPQLQQLIINNDMVRTKPTEGQCSHEKYSFKCFKGRVASYYRLNGDGILQNRIPFETGKVGEDYSQRPGVKYVIENHKPHVSEVIETSVSKMKAISVCHPVFSDQEFVGVARAIIPLDTIQELINHIKVGKKGYAWVIDDDMTMLAHPKTEHIGEDTLKVRRAAFPEHNWSDMKDLLSRMARGQQGVAIHHSAWWQDEEIQIVKKISAFAPIKIGDELWSINVCMSYDEISEPVTAHSENLLIGALFLIVLFGGVYFEFYRIDKKRVRLHERVKATEALESINRQLGKEVAERKQTEKELQDSKNNLLKAQRVVRMGFLEWNLKTNEIHWSDEIFKLYGINSNIKPTLDLTMQLVHPDDLEFVRRNLELAAKGQTEYNIDYRIRRPDGRIIYVHAQAELTHDEDGNPVEMLGTVIDITARKQAEEKLRKERDLSRSLIETAQTVILTLDTEGKIINFNPYMEQLCGYKLEEVKGKDWFETFLPQQDWRRTRELFTQAIGDVQTHGNINPIITKDGSEIDVEWYDKTLKNTNGEVVGLLAVGQNITARKRAEEKLDKMKTRLQYLLASNPAIVYACQPDGDYAASYISENILESLGYTSEEFLQDPKFWVDHIHPDDREKTFTEVKRGFEKGHHNHQYRFRNKDGNYIWVMDRFRVVYDDKGDPAEIVGSIIDVTRRRGVEQKQAELMEKVRSINEELKDFAYVVSHDLKAPLRGVSTISNWLVADYSDKLDENGKEQLALLSSRVERMHNLIDGVLQYSRVGSRHEDKVEIDLNELVPEAIDMVAPPDNIEVTIENQLPTITFGMTRIGQVFQNLISNAVKYMDKPQGQVKIGCTEEDGFWKFSVTDNGPGIEEKDFERIFKMFQTLKARDEFESTGVGLTVVKKIIEMYEGRIWVESTPGTGSTFYFTLPQKQNGVLDETEIKTSVAG